MWLRSSLTAIFLQCLWMRNHHYHHHIHFHVHTESTTFLLSWRTTTKTNPLLSSITSTLQNKNKGHHSNLFLQQLDSFNKIRGGSTTVSKESDDHDNEDTNDDNEDDDTTTNDITKHADFAALQAYRMQQQVLMQLRATFLSEALARRGLPLPTVESVATPEGAQPPQPVDWDCALATEDEPRSCLFSFDAEPNTKVVAPLGTNNWITLSALNRLRRTDPSKVEPMWHNQYAILSSWFDPESEYSLLQHVGIQGFLLNALLQGYRLPIALALSMMIMTIIFMPVIEYVMNRFLVSGFLWMRWTQWSRFVHAALPLKLLLGQMIGKGIATGFDNLVKLVKTKLVEWENEIYEQKIPLTIGVPTISIEEEDEGQDDNDNDVDMGDLDFGNVDDENDEDEEE